MKKKNRHLSLSRRQLIGGAAATVGGIAASPLAAAAESNPANLPPNVPEWTPYLDKASTPAHSVANSLGLTQLQRREVTPLCRQP